LDYQRKAYLLVNPRPIDNLINKLTFPSKIFEYLISGTVVLSTDLTCPTKEYKRNMFVVNSNDPVLLASNINQIFSLSKEFLTIKAYNARKFVMNKKNWEIQSKKVYNFLRSL
jgi:glycosyltransferase involved in cell wall biosynthesis